MRPQRMAGAEGIIAASTDEVSDSSTMAEVNSIDMHTLASTADHSMYIACELNASALFLRIRRLMNSTLTEKAIAK